MLPDLRSTELKRWYEERKCTHAHCPNGCEKPQPFMLALGVVLYCGRCWCYDGMFVAMVPCSPQTCGD